MNTVFKNIPDVQGLAQAIVDTVRDPLLVLDRNLCVITANRSFHDKFGVNRAETEGKAIYTNRH